MVEEGKTAPDFELTSDTGDRVKLSDPRGKPVVSYLSEGRHARLHDAGADPHAYSEFQRRGAVVLGVSPDDEASHVKFRDKYELPFTLPRIRPTRSRGLRGLGREERVRTEEDGIERSTFIIIDAEGNDEGDATREAGHARRRRPGGAAFLMT